MTRVRTRVQRPTPAVQAKMEVTAVNDPSEIEADRTADQVVASIQSGALATALAAPANGGVARAIGRVEEEEALQGKRIGRVEEEEALQGKRIGRVEEEEPLQGKRIARVEEEEPLQGKRIARAAVPGPEGGAVDAELEAAVNNASGGQKLPDPVRQTMEAGFGADFGNVNVHLNSPLAPQLGALAFARGTDVHFAPGQFDPSSAAGQHLIAHELTHVVQQGGAPARSVQRAGDGDASGLADHLKSGIESLSGMSIDQVKVHQNSSVPAQMNALAYAEGSDIHLAPGAEKSLPHEAWHVVQQKQGRVVPTLRL
ncbi:MAG: DUF4157 domain-containing protein [Acidimicrobiales bacterium]|nr:DUF4157 domain-containing protein [Acidimicrobiales bacterium]